MTCIEVFNSSEFLWEIELKVSVDKTYCQICVSVSFFLEGKSKGHH